MSTPVPEISPSTTHYQFVLWLILFLYTSFYFIDNPSSCLIESLILSEIIIILTTIIVITLTKVIPSRVVLQMDIYPLFLQRIPSPLQHVLRPPFLNYFPHFPLSCHASSLSLFSSTSSPSFFTNSKTQL